MLSYNVGSFVCCLVIGAAGVGHCRLLSFGLALMWAVVFFLLDGRVFGPDFKCVDFVCVEAEALRWPFCNLPTVSIILFAGFNRGNRQCCGYQEQAACMRLCGRPDCGYIGQF